MKLTMQKSQIAALAAYAIPLCGLLTPAHADVLLDPTNPDWARPGSDTIAAAGKTLYAEWDGFTTESTTTSMKPTGVSYLGGLTPVPTVRNTSDQSTAAFSSILGATTITSPYYPANTKAGDMYSTGTITPEVVIPAYNIAGNSTKVLIQITTLGSAIDQSLLTVNGAAASTLPGYSAFYAHQDNNPTDNGFGTTYNNTYAWTFSVSNGPSSLTLDFGWGASSAAMVALSVDTLSSAVPEPASLGLLGVSSLLLLRRRASR